MSVLVDGIPWYQSRSVWGAVASGVSSFSLLLGHTIDPVVMDSAIDVILGLGSLVGSAVALYGRVVATKRIA